jgi:signal transduction histidine kinase
VGGRRLPLEIARAARKLVSADASSVWLLSGTTWSVAAQDGLSDQYNHEAVAHRGPVEFDEPIQVSDTAIDSLTKTRREAHAREGIRAMLVVPLRIQDVNSGTLVLYQRTPRHFSDVEVSMAGALGRVAASALHIADLYAAREQAAQRAAFLAQAGTLLAGALDVKDTLSQVASLAVPHVSDWCGVDLLRADGAIEHLVAAHVDPGKVALANRLRRDYPSDASAETGVPQVIRSGQPQIFPEITDAMLAAGAKDDTHRELLLTLDIRSVLIVPMIARERAVGAITLVATSESGRIFDETDLAFAEALASRAAIAIDNARLYQEAQDANRLKDDFFATLSHELRTPINAVLGWAQLLSDGVLDEAGRTRAIRAIDRNARAQAQLLTDILELSRIVAGKLELHVEPIDLGALAAELVDSLRPSFDAREQQVSSPDREGPTIQGDRPRLQQVLFNLLSNAGKFTPAGGRIDVSLAEHDDQVEIRVSDNGAGIPAEFLPHVFERFRQADASATREHGGLGIGLAVARHIVEMHGGTIVAESEGPGKGATFSVRLPRARRADAAPST